MTDHTYAFTLKPGLGTEDLTSSLINNLGNNSIIIFYFS